MQASLDDVETDEERDGRLYRTRRSLEAIRVSHENLTGHTVPQQGCYNCAIITGRKSK